MIFNPRDAEWVFVGCGGTFFCQWPYLQVLLARYRPAVVRFFDGDTLEDHNAGRQWPLYSGLHKATIPYTELMNLPNWRSMRLYTQDHLTRPEMKALRWEKRPLVVVCNVDNNDARLICRELCLQRTLTHPAAMMVTGCAGENGQAYWGLWTPADDVFITKHHDWLPLHPDVNDTTVDLRPPCGGQTIFSNAITAALGGMALENMLECINSGGETPVMEYYWDRKGFTVKAKTVRVSS